MVERIAELDDALTVRYLEGQELSISELKSALRNAVIRVGPRQFFVVLP